jgi:TRAP-type C4-dicarboxylate transport system permease small subunit
MKYLYRLEDGVVAAERTLIVSFVALMTGLSFLQVVLRLAFHSGIVWLDPALRHMVLWTGLTGAALATRYARHFALDALVKFLPPRLHGPLNVFTGLFTAAAAAALFAAARKFIRDEFAADSVAFYIGHFGVKGGWAGLILPLSFLLICFHSLVGVFRPKEPSEGAL